MDIQAMRESERRTVADLSRDVIAVDVGLQFVGGAEHDEVGIERRHPPPA